MNSSLLFGVTRPGFEANLQSSVPRAQSPKAVVPKLVRAVTQIKAAIMSYYP